MKIDLNNLPSDTSILHKIVTDLVNHTLSLQDQMKRLQEQLKLLQAKRFGKSSEKLDKETALFYNYISSINHIQILLNKFFIIAIKYLKLYTAVTISF